MNQTSRRAGIPKPLPESIRPHGLKGEMMDFLLPLGDEFSRLVIKDEKYFKALGAVTLLSSIAPSAQFVVAAYCSIHQSSAQWQSEAITKEKVKKFVFRLNLCLSIPVFCALFTAFYNSIAILEDNIGHVEILPTWAVFMVSILSTALFWVLGNQAERKNLELTISELSAKCIRRGSCSLIFLGIFSGSLLLVENFR